ncbi:MAG: NADH-quinone oxidoreductase subunit C [Legionellaceae bacterium]|nr:NADH-quinone oxidoreductase subunit C [Legionellaceae bacterium]
MTKAEQLQQLIQQEFASEIMSLKQDCQEVTVEVDKRQVHSFLKKLREHTQCPFEQLIDLCAVDYLLYGEYDWETESASENGFSRAVERQHAKSQVLSKPRFAVVYHLLSIHNNVRIRVKTFLSEDDLIVDSVHDLWLGANWFEREAYDFYGILFNGHPDLRRILTDYGFIGHPFRKDFPLSGQVEMRYDARLRKVIYEPVDIEPRILVPKVIRSDNRYLGRQEGQYD